MTLMDLVQIMPRDEFVSFLAKFGRMCIANDENVCNVERVSGTKITEWLMKDIHGEPEEWESESIKKLELKPRTYEALYTAGIRTLGDIIKLRAYDLKKIPHIGESGISDIIASVEQYTGCKIPD